MKNENYSQYLQKLDEKTFFYSEDKVNEDLTIFFKNHITFDASVKSFSSNDLNLGRAEILKLTYENKNFIARNFKRGGLVSNFNESLFLKQPRFPLDSRPVHEYKILRRLRTNGIKVPLVSGCLIKTIAKIFYQGVLITNEIKEPENLLLLILSNSKVDKTKILEYCFLAGQEARKVLDLGILHVDLHPGNVLISKNQIYLIDFDKAKTCQNQEVASKADIEFLCRRWSRSLKKRLENESYLKAYGESFSSGVLNK